MSNESIFEGYFDKVNSIFPSEMIFNNYKYSIIDGIYVAGIIVINYSRINEINWLDSLFSCDINMDISMFYEKANSSEVIKDLTYYIGNTGATLKTIGENQQDIDIINTVHNDAKYIRRELQINQEELYYLSLYINTYSKNLDELNKNILKIQGICNSIGMQTRRANFRQEMLFKSTLPLFEHNKDLKHISKRNILTKALSSTYPFTSVELCDENGVLMGHNSHNKSLVIIDRFDKSKYKNANMCILGTSGSGKSYTVKTLIIRNSFLDICQYVIDPDREYKSICDALEGTYFRFGPNSKSYINIMDIRQSVENEEEKGYLSNKISKLHIFFSFIFDNMSSIQKAYLDEKLVKCYKDKGITFDDKTLYEEEDYSKVQIKPIFKDTYKMPLLSDLYKLLLEDVNTKELAVKLKPYVEGSFNFFNKYTNININNKLIVADIHDLTDEQIPLGMYIITDLFWDKIKENRDKNKIIYIDELWRLIGSSGNIKSAEYVYKIFKTIRKYGGAATAITQDVHDFFALENGKYGKALINNSKFKFILQLEEEDIKLLKEILNLSEEEEMKIRNFDKGEGIFYGDKNNIILKVETSEKEHLIIEGEDTNESYNST